MWRRLRNLFHSVQTYGILSPDLVARRLVNQSLSQRPAMTQEQWFQAFCQPMGVTPAVATFAYTHLQHYSGIQFARVIASDRLVEDLHWFEVCWADWEMAFCEDFWHSFGIDISDPLLNYPLSTVGEFVLFLNVQLLTLTSSEDDSVNSK
ncbi:hypothetical protein H6G89_02610 [Oscillatoria sp. FACHB-1407]|uniref:hypothetical protein n=1 Tax=Oscillatoria sp. FACHB-1407 TaxID=2692847 RepID=UPI0016856BE6|nr:hypothetical protein [Oscillatoria sp. FACHB-1407]MBD2459927.1 hypothetical protein [Oscillatoria sp. FACHB-1407]